MNIAIDIDDTITNTYETLLPMVAIHYGLNIDQLFKKKPSYKSIEKMMTDYKSFARENYSRIAKMVPVKKDAAEIIRKLKDEGHRIIIVTARNNAGFGDPYQTCADYLTANDIPFDKLIVNVSNKAKECVLENVDLFIDDDTMNCKAVKRRGIPTLQMKTIFSKGSKEIRSVNNWKEIYKIVQEMYSI